MVGFLSHSIVVTLLYILVKIVFNRFVKQSSPVYTDSEGAIESVRINGVFVLSGSN